jgi:hypothetical protein
MNSYHKTNNFLRFEVTTGVLMNFISWDITFNIQLQVNLRFGRTYRFHLQGRVIGKSRNPVKQVANVSFLVYSSTTEV